ncbi:unnamed protein product [Ectocarpus sp. CCAP 1310/34]|nr:unnamed protein product [Ectocarpus sp. CCAP 1310/34]
MRERTGGNVRSFVEAAGVADKFPALKCGDPDVDKLVLCKRGGCLLELFVLNKQKESRAPSKRRAKRGPKWTCAPEPVKQLKRRCFDRYCTSPAALEALLGDVSISGCVLDTCGGAGDAIVTRLRDTCQVLTNDVRPRTDLVVQSTPSFTCLLS